MKRVLLSLVLASGIGAPALALDLVPYGTSGDWSVLSDPNKGNNCLAQVTYEDGTLLRIGFLDKAKKGFIASFHPGWAEFKEDHKYAVSYTVATGTESLSYDAEAKGRKVGDLPGAELTFEDPLVLEGLVKADTITFTYNGVDLVTGSLKGSADALALTATCEEEQKG